MRAARYLSVFIGFAVLSSPAFAQYKIGDKVIIIHNTEIRVGEKSLQRLSRGLPLKVEDVKDGWLWVSHKATGWIKTQDVTSPPEAVGIFSEQIRQNPRDSGAYTARGMAWHGRGETDIAIRDYTEAIRLDPMNSAAWGNRGNCWSQKKEIDKAMSDYTESVRLDPTDSISYSNRARIWIKKSEFDNAIADATDAIRHSPAFEGAYSIRAAAWASKKQFDRARADCEECHRLNPKSGWGYNEVAWSLATNADEKLRDGKKAVEFARRACEITDWKQALCIGTLAASYAESGDFKLAVEMQSKAHNMYTEQEQKFWGHLLDLYKSGRPYRDESRM